MEEYFSKFEIAGNKRAKVITVHFSKFRDDPRYPLSEVRFYGILIEDKRGFETYVASKHYPLTFQVVPPIDRFSIRKSYRNGSESRWQDVLRNMNIKHALHLYLNWPGEHIISHEWEDSSREMILI